VSTPGGDGENPYGPPAGSNPYGPPAGSDPYGAPSGSNPYASYPGAPGTPGSQGGQAPLDGVSIASFVLSLLCCTGLIGLILGIVGVVRTKDGQRRGRWAAVSGIVIGAVAVAAGIGFGIFVAFVANSVVTPDNAEVGQCVDVEDDGDDLVNMIEKDCDGEHDAEILYVGEYDPDEHGAELEPSVCAELVPADLQQAAQEQVTNPQFKMVYEDLDDPQPGDSFVCYVEGDDLTEPIG
jgi:hypothetical protein